MLGLSQVFLGMPVSKAAELGSACGSLVASGLGSDAGIVNLESTLAFIESTPTLPLSVETTGDINGIFS